MRSRSLLYIMTPIFAAVSSVGAAEDITEKAGSWSVVTRAAPGSLPDPRCIIVGPQEAGTATFAMDNLLSGSTSHKQGSARLLISVPEPLLSQDTVLEGVSVAIPGQKTRSGLQAIWTVSGGGGTLVFTAEDNVKDFVRPLERGSSLELTVPLPEAEPKTIQVSLNGSGAALKVYRRCLALIK